MINASESPQDISPQDGATENVIITEKKRAGNEYSAKRRVCLYVQRVSGHSRLQDFETVSLEHAAGKVFEKD